MLLFRSGWGFRELLYLPVIVPTKIHPNRLYIAFCNSINIYEVFF